MINYDLYLKNLTGKDENKAQEAADYLVNESDIQLFKMLVDKTDYLFDFVRNNVCSRIEKAVNKNNVMNVINFFSVYSQYYDDLFASILAKYANEDLTDEMFKLLENGTIEQKTYSAKYFSYIPDTVALEPLSKYAFLDDESLAYNSAEALGQMQDDISYDIALAGLQNDDDFEKLKSVKFFTAYAKNYPVDEIFKAMKTSKMPENIAGQIPYVRSLFELLDSDKSKLDTLITVDYILSGLGEILPLSDIFQFELFEIFEKLIKENNTENKYFDKTAEVLLKAHSKFTLFNENDEYTFDEDKNTKQEIKAIFELLNSQSEEFWNLQKKFIVNELNKATDRILSALPIISIYSISGSENLIKKLLGDNEDEIVIFESLSTLKALNKLTNEDIEQALLKIQNPNMRAIIENLKG